MVGSPKCTSSTKLYNNLLQPNYTYIYICKKNACKKLKHSCLRRPVAFAKRLDYVNLDVNQVDRGTLTLGDGSRRLGVETDDQGEHWNENSTTSDPSNATQCCAKESYY